MTYPTAHEFLCHFGRVRRRDAMHCQAVAGELRDMLLHQKVDLDLRLQAITRICDALTNSRRYQFEARVSGFKLPG